MNQSETFEERFWSKVEFIPEHPCWEWNAAKNETGYGKMSSGIRGEGNLKAHRASWIINRGPIPEGACVLHKCDNPGCVNPNHLFLGTKKDNSQDMIKKGRGKGHFQSGSLDPRSNGGRWNILKTHCPQGHPYDETNTFINKRGSRNCRSCCRIWAARKRGA